MNYFTSERLVRLQDRSDERRFLGALEEWEHALEGYKKHLLQVRDALPDDMQQLINTVYLHDARVLDMWWGGRSQFNITLYPESDPSRLVVLTYSLLEPPRGRGGRVAGIRPLRAGCLALRRTGFGARNQTG